MKSINIFYKFIDRLKNRQKKKNKLHGNMLISVFGNTTYTKVNLNTYYCIKHQRNFSVNEKAKICT